jgi:hypothetical protein
MSQGGVPMYESSKDMACKTTPGLPSDRPIIAGMNQSAVPRDPDVPPELWARMIRVVKAEAIAGWLDTEVPLLDGQTPRALIRAGNVDAVSQIIADLESGNYLT